MTATSGISRSSFCQTFSDVLNGRRGCLPNGQSAHPSFVIDDRYSLCSPKSVLGQPFRRWTTIFPRGISGQRTTTTTRSSQFYLLLFLSRSHDNNWLGSSNVFVVRRNVTSLDRNIVQHLREMINKLLLLLLSAVTTVFINIACPRKVSNNHW